MKNSILDISYIKNSEVYYFQNSELSKYFKYAEVIIRIFKILFLKLKTSKFRFFNFIFLIFGTIKIFKVGHKSYFQNSVLLNTVLRNSAFPNFIFQSTGF